MGAAWAGAPTLMLFGVVDDRSGVAYQCEAHLPHRRRGLHKGNFAAVISGNTIAFAIAADLGPEKQFGERSAAFHWRRGHETVGKPPTNPLCAKDESLNAEVIFVVARDRTIGGCQ